MADSDWVGYIGAATGVIGAIAGIAGSILGYVAYRRSDQLKALDLRLELRKNATSLAITGKELPPLLEKAKTSRVAVAAAAGMYKSGATEKWMTEWDQDVAQIKTFLAELPDPKDPYLNLSSDALETKLIELHGLQETISRFQKKYEESIVKDDKDREQIVAARSVRS